ncbi:ribosomal protein S30-domain-containing protein [Desarmillaria tabescens]|nr:ribosomal protein S30-domain-containing protein [Desarmillaria tabescens]KAK0431339.1 ribosomal protein S30-domain-containing protein [Desarmillaria tabescens]
MSLPKTAGTLRQVIAETLCGQLHSRADSGPSSSALASPQDNMGKVHGSLARAGKVKSQTPKVEAQEKKKTPKGRAKKRVLYNRR